MYIDPAWLEMAFDRGGVRNSQKRLKSLITELAVDPLAQYEDALIGQFSLVETIVQKRVAAVITYWCQHKHDPVKPTSKAMMSAITNSTRHDATLEEFYVEQVKGAMYTLAPKFSLTMPDSYEIQTDELEYALLELEDRFDLTEARVVDGSEEPAEYDSDEEQDEDFDYLSLFEEDPVYAPVAELVTEQKPAQKPARSEQEKQTIIVTNQNQITKVEPTETTSVAVLNLTAERAWQLTYGLIGYPSEYIQQQMLPRWQQYPAMFEQDRRFLYEIFIETIQNAAGTRIIAGNLTFMDRPVTIDQLWNHYYADLVQNVGPYLTAAKLHAAANDPWYKKMLGAWWNNIRSISPIWMIALVIALVFDGLTTYVSLDQTPMEGPMVAIFTALITTLFQIADLLVISYRKREFESDALIAKFRAKYDQLNRTLESLSPASDSFVQLSMEKSQVQADWKASEDNRKMARRGRFWSARIADINIAVTAYGFAFLFLNSEEPMGAIFQQIDAVILRGMWQDLDIWVFLMVGMAITVSFVINTAQRTEILGWSMNRMKKA